MARNIELSESADRELGKLDVQQTGKRPVSARIDSDGRAKTESQSSAKAAPSNPTGAAPRLASTLNLGAAHLPVPTITRSCARSVDNQQEDGIALLLLNV